MSGPGGMKKPITPAPMRSHDHAAIGVAIRIDIIPFVARNSKAAADANSVQLVHGYLSKNERQAEAKYKKAAQDVPRIINLSNPYCSLLQCLKTVRPAGFKSVTSSD